MKISPRHKPTTLAKIAIDQAVCDAVSRHGLTYAELMSILAQAIASWTKFQIREERKEVTTSPE